MVRISSSLIVVSAALTCSIASTSKAQHAGLSIFDEIRLHGMAQAIVALQPLWCAPQKVVDDVKGKLEDRDDATRVPGLLELSHAYSFDGERLRLAEVPLVSTRFRRKTHAQNVKSGQDFQDLVGSLKSVAYSCPKLKTCPAVFSNASAGSGDGYESGAFLNAQRHGHSVALREAVRGSLHEASKARRLQLEQLLGSLGNLGGGGGGDDGGNGFDLSKTISSVTRTLCNDITPKICDLETHSLKPTTTAILKIVLDVFKRPTEDLPLLEQLITDLACTRTAIEAICPISTWQDLGV